MIDEIRKDITIYKLLGQAKQEKPEDYDFIKKIKKRLHTEKKSAIIIIVGEPGSGKSWASLKLAENIDPNFSVEQVAFYRSQFMGLMKEHEKYPPGSAFVFDDAGVEYSNRKYHDNITMNFILQTIRYRRFCFIINVPVFDFIDKQGRQLCHAKFKMQRIIRSRKESIMIPYVQDNDGFGYVRTGYPLLKGLLISEIILSQPTLKIRREYEKKAKEFKDQISIRNYEVEKLKERMQSAEIISQQLQPKNPQERPTADITAPLITAPSRLKYNEEKQDLEEVWED